MNSSEQSKIHAQLQGPFKGVPEKQGIDNFMWKLLC
jgi:hypothetical protein